MDTKYQLKIDAHVVKQLGDELISDPEQAILELVKNAYDADSGWCLVQIDTDYTESVQERRYYHEDLGPPAPTDTTTSEYRGKITIEDGGCGMGLEQIERGWLTISHSEKRLLKSARKITTKYERAYQGDKGLGRLSTMKLGKLLRIATKTETEGATVSLNWSDFRAGVTLDKIGVSVDVDSSLKPGTTIEIIGLHSGEYWKGSEAAQKVQSKISSLISPFEFDSEFRVTFSIDGSEYSLSKFTQQLLRAAVAQFTYSYDQNELSCKGKVKLPYFLPGSMQEENVRGEGAFKKYIAPDKGEALLRYLRSNSRHLKEMSLDREQDGDWYISFSKKYLWRDMPKRDATLVQSPGCFSAELNYVYKKGPAYNLIVGDKLTPNDRQAIDSLIGVGVYKESFRVGTDSRKDWLGFSTDKTSGRSFYSLRPENVIGYIRFKGYEGDTLKEKSDRQGFVQDEYFAGFWLITRSMLDFANGFLSHSRRALTDFVNEQDKEYHGKPTSYTGQDAAFEINQLVESASKSKLALSSSEAEAKQAISIAKEKIESALNDLFLDEKVRAEILVLKDQVRNVHQTFEGFSTEYRKLVTVISRHQHAADTIIGELEGFKSKVNDFYDAASIGLSAENLAHEINPLLDDIILNANQAKASLKKSPNKITSVIANINSIISVTKVIAKDISLINPMLRSRRGQLSKFSVKDAVLEYCNLRKEKHEFAKVSVEVVSGGQVPTICFSRGKFTQILDNLFRNSEYWLDNAAKHGVVSKKITVEIEARGLKLWDNGYGVADNIQHSLFEMFSTNKTDGQGLGLFITRQILEQGGCSIVLLDDLNSHDRRYVFYIDFAGALA